MNKDTSREEMVKALIGTEAEFEIVFGKIGKELPEEKKKVLLDLRKKIMDVLEMPKDIHEASFIKEPPIGRNKLVGCFEFTGRECITSKPLDPGLSLYGTVDGKPGLPIDISRKVPDLAAIDAFFKDLYEERVARKAVMLPDMINSEFSGKADAAARIREYFGGSPNRTLMFPNSNGKTGMLAFTGKQLYRDVGCLSRHETVEDPVFPHIGFPFLEDYPKLLPHVADLAFESYSSHPGLLLTGLNSLTSRCRNGGFKHGELSGIYGSAFTSPSLSAIGKTPYLFNMERDEYEYLDLLRWGRTVRQFTRPARVILSSDGIIDQARGYLRDTRCGGYSHAIMMRRAVLARSISGEVVQAPLTVVTIAGNQLWVGGKRMVTFPGRMLHQKHYFALHSDGNYTDDYTGDCQALYNYRAVAGHKRELWAELVVDQMIYERHYGPLTTHKGYPDWTRYQIKLLAAKIKDKARLSEAYGVDVNNPGRNKQTPVKSKGQYWGDKKRIG